MSMLWRRFVIGFTAIVCLWLFVFRLYGFAVKDYIENISNFSQSWTIEPFTLSNSSGLITVFPLPSNRCRANNNRETFAALLSQWHIMSRFHKIPYVIGCGSLLGQYRDGDIIPWDEDVDVLVDIRRFKALKAFGGKRNFKQGDDDKFHFVVQKDFEQREEDDRRRLSCIGQVVHEQIDSCSFVSPMARVIHGFHHLDIFPYVVYREKQKVRDLDMETNYKMKDFFPFKECVFMDVKTWCPRNIRGVLEAAYDHLEPDYSCINRTWVYNRS